MTKHEFMKTITGKWGAIAVMACLACGLASAAQAAIQATDGGVQSNGFYSVSATDIGEVPPASFTYSGTILLGDPSKLFNGTVYGGNPPSDATECLIPASAPFTITSSFDLTSAPLGYDLYSVVSLTATGDGQGERLLQHYTLAYSTVSDPSTFLSFPGLPDVFANYGTHDDSELQVTVNDSLGAPIATGVAKLLITFENGGPFYREFDINGIASPVPEPSVAMLFAVGALVTWRKRRRI